MQKTNKQVNKKRILLDASLSKIWRNIGQWHFSDKSLFLKINLAYRANLRYRPYYFFYGITWKTLSIFHFIVPTSLYCQVNIAFFAFFNLSITNRFTFDQWVTNWSFIRRHKDRTKSIR